MRSPISQVLNEQLIHDAQIALVTHARRLQEAADDGASLIIKSHSR